MWEKLLLEVRKIEEDYGDTLNTPPSNGEIENLKKEVKEKFNHILPEQYVNFLKVTNGFEFNGFIFYGVDSTLLDGQNNQLTYGYVKINESWYENEHQKQYMFFGDSNISWYCFDLLKGVYAEIDKPSGTLIHTFNDFNAMLEKALEDSLL